MLAERTALPQHLVDQGGLAVVDVRHDGDVAEVGAARWTSGCWSCSGRRCSCGLPSAAGGPARARRQTGLGVSGIGAEGRIAESIVTSVSVFRVLGSWCSAAWSWSVAVTWPARRCRARPTRPAPQPPNATCRPVPRPSAARADDRAGPGTPARQPPLPAADQPAGPRRRLPEALQHHGHGDQQRRARGDGELPPVAGGEAPTRGPRRHASG